MDGLVGEECKFAGVGGDTDPATVDGKQYCHVMYLNIELYHIKH